MRQESVLGNGQILRWSEKAQRRGVLVVLVKYYGLQSRYMVTKSFDVRDILDF